MSGGSVVTLVLDSGAGPRSSSLPCGAGAAAAEKRPAPVGELTSGVWYVDLTRAHDGEDHAGAAQARAAQPASCSTSAAIRPTPASRFFRI